MRTDPTLLSLIAQPLLLVAFIRQTIIFLAGTRGSKITQRLANTLHIGSLLCRDMSQSLSDLDPTGTLNTAKAAVGLVGAVARTVPALKNASNAVRNQSGSSKGPEPLHRAQTSTEAPPVVVDPAQEKRAYEAVNLVLRELGSRICAAGLVNEHALGIALTAATQQVNLFSGQTNRLFASIAGDPLLVNAVFTSIYFIGALTAELSHSLPNYKETHPPLGPWIVQQLFRTAIGEDAFRDNLTANLDAYKTVAATAGLLRPTDIGYSTFPGIYLWNLNSAVR